MTVSTCVIMNDASISSSFLGDAESYVGLSVYA
jgi:hypothetical protein